MKSEEPPRRGVFHCGVRSRTKKSVFRPGAIFGYHHHIWPIGTTSRRCATKRVFSGMYRFRSRWAARSCSQSRCFLAGDKLRPETTPLYEQLSFTVAKMIPAAEVVHLPPNVGVGSYKPISDAQAVFQYRFYGAMRFAIVGEYIHQWCDFVCKNYADYARLALYKQGAFLGDPVKNNMFDEDIWQWQKTAMPSVDDFHIDKNH